jgi:outer membrane lipoprotein-sorting protein
MRVIATRPALRWLVPIGVICAIALIATMTAVLRSGSGRALPPRSAASLLVGMTSADVKGVSGTVVERADLGLPALPDGFGASGTDWASLLAGSHTLRVWSAGPTMTRIALLSALGESDVIRDGKDLWIWSSSNNTANHVTLPAGSSGRANGASPNPAPSGLGSLLPTSPIQAVSGLMRLLDKSTSIRNAGTVTVAGRPAYELVIAPRDTRSLVANIRIDIDSTENVPLRVRVFARGYGSPAFDIGFTQVSFDRPDAALFHFNPPPGATVNQVKPPAANRTPAPDNSGPLAGASARATVIGSGWTTILAARAPVGQIGARVVPPSVPPSNEGAQPGPAGSGLGAILNTLPRVSGAWGSGKMLSTRLLSVLVTDDGRVFAGSVAPSALTAAAGTPAGQLTAPAPSAHAPKAPATPKPSPTR